VANDWRWQVSVHQIRPVIVGTVENRLAESVRKAERWCESISGKADDFEMLMLAVRELERRKKLLQQHQRGEGV
jgi:hypothetical protein